MAYGVLINGYLLWYMICCIVLHHPVSYTPHRATVYHLVIHYHCVTLQRITIHCIKSYHTTSHCFTLFHTASHHVTMRHTAFHHITLRHIASECVRVGQRNTASHSSYSNTDIISVIFFFIKLKIKTIATIRLLKCFFLEIFVIGRFALRASTA